jgi:hypothetical protein
MSNFFWPASGSGATPSQIEAAIDAALASFFPTDVLDQIYHANSVNNVTTSFTEVGGAGQGTIPAGTKKIQVSSTTGKPLQFGIGANAGAAVAKFNIVAGGGPIEFPVQFAAADILCVLNLDTGTISTGNFVINFLG